jgi:hypothetical protein
MIRGIHLPKAEQPLIPSSPYNEMLFELMASLYISSLAHFVRFLSEFSEWASCTSRKERLMHWIIGLMTLKVSTWGDTSTWQCGFQENKSRQNVCPHLQSAEEDSKALYEGGKA